MTIRRSVFLWDTSEDPLYQPRFRSRHSDQSSHFHSFFQPHLVRKSDRYRIISVQLRYMHFSMSYEIVGYTFTCIDCVEVRIAPVYRLPPSLLCRFDFLRPVPRGDLPFSYCLNSSTTLHVRAGLRLWTNWAVVHWFVLNSSKRTAEFALLRAVRYVNMYKPALY